MYRHVIGISLMAWAGAASAQTGRCPDGQVMVGVEAGLPICEPVAAVIEAGSEAAPSLKKGQAESAGPRRAQVAAPIAAAVQPDGLGAYVVKMAALKAAWGDDLMARAARQARVVPRMVDGKIVGFRLAGIRARSALARGGLKNGDIITAVNGQALSGPAEAMALYVALSAKALPQTITVDALRGGAPLKLTYTVQP